jgi:sugar phosphate isomerase/epimerase
MVFINKAIMYKFVYLIFLSFLLSLVISCSSRKESQNLKSTQKELDNPVFVFNNAFYNKEPVINLEDQAELLKNLGFDGIEHREVDGLFELKEVFDEHGLKVFADYMRIDIDAEEPYLPEWREAIPQLKGSNIILWAHIHSEKFNSSDEKADSIVVSVLRELAEFSKPYGVRIAIYPHVNFLAEKAEDSYRLAVKTNRENVGAVFNLCHFLKTDDQNNLYNVIDHVFPKLFAVSISGADSGDTQNMGWDQLIQPLGVGSFEVYDLVKYLADKGYRGPFGIQCYNIKTPPQTFLTQSSEAWKSFQKRYSESR